MARILIADDNAFMRENLRNLLTAAGFEVVAEAFDGVEAVEAYSRTRPDLVTMDITMPRMDGLEALGELKRIDPAARVIMVCALGQEPLIVEALAGGASDFVVKPFAVARVMEAINNALAA